MKTKKKKKSIFGLEPIYNFDSEKKSKKKSYHKKPSFEKYKKNIFESDPLERKHLYKIQKKQEEKYAKQQAQIKSGEIPSERKARYEEIKKNIQKKTEKALSTRMA